MSDAWQNGARYQAYIGRWSGPVAAAFVRWLSLPQGGSWLEVGCGTGALTERILALAVPAAVVAVDASEGYLAHARQAIPDARVRFEVADARRIPVEDSSEDAAVSGLVLNFVPDCERMVAEMARAVRPGGTVAVYVWDYAGRMELLRHFWDAAAALDPAASELDEGRRFPICAPEALGDLWRRARLEAVELLPIDVPTKFRDFEDYWEPFLGGQGPAPGYVASLDERRRRKLHERLRSVIPTTSTGGIELVARAWAVRGTRAP